MHRNPTNSDNLHTFTYMYHVGNHNKDEEQHGLNPPDLHFDDLPTDDPTLSSLNLNLLGDKRVKIEPKTSFANERVFQTLFVFGYSVLVLGVLLLHKELSPALAQGSDK